MNINRAHGFDTTDGDVLAHLPTFA